jgi:nudix-type nucleoside diphosphatase (YffH/AdpP family)
VLSDQTYLLRRAAFEYQAKDGTWTTQQREVYDRGNGVAILLLDRQADTVVLTRQFRAPAYLNGHPDGMLIEVPAGLDDGEAAEIAIRREVEEETGLVVGATHRLFELFMSPGAVTERITFFWAEYSSEDRLGPGGGAPDEGEDIEVLELPLSEAWAMVHAGVIVDAKTVILLQWAMATTAGPSPY